MLHVPVTTGVINPPVVIVAILLLELAHGDGPAVAVPNNCKVEDLQTFAVVIEDPPAERLTVGAAFTVME